MSVTLTLKNQTPGIVPIPDVGTQIPASGQDTYANASLLLKCGRSADLRYGEPL